MSVTINTTPLARGIATMYGVHARRESERHVLDAVVEAARAIAAAAEWPVTVDSAAAAAGHIVRVRRHYRAARAHEDVAKACDAVLAKLATEEP